MKRKYGKKRYRKSRRRYKKRSRKYKAKTATKSRTGTVVSDRMLTKLRYAEEIAMFQGVGVIPVVQTMSGNSCYDPNNTGIGGQPTGFDQWATFYKRYKVYASKVKCQFLSVAGTVASQNFFATLVPTTDVLGPSTSQDEAQMLPYSKTKTFAVGAPWAANLVGYMGTEKMLGLNKKAVEVDDTLQALTNNNPSRQWYWNVLIKGVGGNLASCTLRIQVTYYVEFFDRVTLEAS